LARTIGISNGTTNLWPVSMCWKCPGAINAHVEPAVRARGNPFIGEILRTYPATLPAAQQRRGNTQMTLPKYSSEILRPELRRLPRYRSSWDARARPPPPLARLPGCLTTFTQQSPSQVPPLHADRAEQLLSQAISRCGTIRSKCQQCSATRCAGDGGRLRGVASVHAAQE